MPPKRRNYLDLLDIYFLRHLLVEYVDCKSLVALSMTCKTIHEIISGEGGVADELLFRISPLLTDHRRVNNGTKRQYFKFSAKLHTINYYEEIRRAKRQFMVSCGEEHTVIATKDSSSLARANLGGCNRVMTFGSGGEGRLGLGDEEDCEIAKEVKIPDVDLQAGRTSVRSVVGGFNHTLVLLENGRLYGFGDNSQGQLGPHLPSRAILQPTNVRLPKVKVSMISCARYYSAIVLDDDVGTVILFGTGLPAKTTKYKNTKFSCLIRGEIAPSEKITDVSAGYYHLLMINEVGKPYAVGSNVCGQLGVGRVVEESTPASPTQEKVVVDEPCCVNFNYQTNPVAQVAAGEQHSMLLTRDGNLFTWGDGSKGQLGDGKFNRKNYLPQEIKLPSRCFPIIITCGNNHSVVLDIDGKTLTFGQNEFGQTGTTSTFFSVSRATVVNSGAFTKTENTLRKLHDIAAGNTHTAVSGKMSKLYMFGERTKCGGGGFTMKNCHKVKPIAVDLSGYTVATAEKKVFYTPFYRRV